ncbi:hypothetical protein [Hymenobacter koreensis]|uniref:hypothetical protein n=1 Tax=Hymenobacter koreensis TaxID=1084523 RepID=UPI0031F12984
MYFYDEHRQELLTHTLGGPVASTRRRSTHGIFPGGFPESFVPISLDSLYFLNRDGDLLVLCDSAGARRGQWPRSAPLASGATNYFWHTGLSGLHAQGRYVLMQQSINGGDVFTNETARKKYYAAPFGILLDTRTNRAVNNLGRIPATINSANTQYTFYGQTAISSAGHFLFTYPYSEDVWAYRPDGTYQKKQVSAAAFVAPRPYPADSLSDDKYSIWYTYNQFRFVDLIADPYHHVNYRILQHPSRVTFQDGLRVVTPPAAWTLVVFDNDLRTLGEVSFPIRLDKNVVLPTPQGLLIKKKHDLKSDWEFELYQLPLPKR